MFKKLNSQEYDFVKNYLEFSQLFKLTTEKDFVKNTKTFKDYKEISAKGIKVYLFLGYDSPAKDFSYHNKMMICIFPKSMDSKLDSYVIWYSADLDDSLRSRKNILNNAKIARSYLPTSQEMKGLSDYLPEPMLVNGFSKEYPI